jgi:hypothetical protein
MHLLAAIVGPPGSPKPIGRARVKTEQVQDELTVAGAELHLSNAALGRKLPETEKTSDVQKALKQSEAVEEKVVDAAEELHEVKELLDEEIAERERLERELKRLSS